MSARQLTKNQVFGKEEKPTIYYLTGYGVPIKRHHLHILALQVCGFRIFAVESDRAILDDGNPKLMLQCLDEIHEIINRDKANHKIGGVYGVSLGGFLGINVAVMCGIKRSILVGGGTNLAKLIWTKPAMKYSRASFRKKGETLSSLAQAWKNIDLSEDGSKYFGKQFLFMNSTRDEVVDIEDGTRCINAWRDQGVQVQQLVINYFNHVNSCIWFFTKLRKTTKFYLDKKSAA